MKNQNIAWVVASFMAFGAFARLIPHVPNFTPTEGLALFGAAYLGRKHWAILATVVMLYLSDFVINNTIARPFFTEQTGVIWFSNYMIYNLIAIVGIVTLGSVFLKKVNAISVIGTSVGATILFYLVTIWFLGDRNHVVQ